MKFNHLISFPISTTKPLVPLAKLSKTNFPASLLSQSKHRIFSISTNRGFSTDNKPSNKETGESNEKDQEPQKNSSEKTGAQKPKNQLKDKIVFAVIVLVVGRQIQENINKGKKRQLEQAQAKNQPGETFANESDAKEVVEKAEQKAEQSK